MAIQAHGGWNKWRVRTGTLTDPDTDHVDLQTSPTESELFPVIPSASNSRSGGPTPNAIMLFVDWIDNNDEILTPDAGTTRGTFDVTILEVCKNLVDEDGPPADAATIIIDSTTLTSQSGYRGIIIDGLRNSLVWPRFTNVVVPTTGSPTKMRVWVKALERG